MKRTLTLALLFAAAACGGGKAKPAETAHAHEHGTGGSAGHDHADLPPEMKAFHDLLAPRWHAARDAKRTADTCGTIADLRPPPTRSRR